MPEPRQKSRWIDAAILAVGLAAVYGILQIAHTWAGPFRPAVVISRSPAALPLYAAYSLFRIVLAYLLSLVFALGYGYLAAYSKRAEKLLIPLLDILQSIPVLSFLPGVMLAMVALFPGRQIGVELGSILLIFTGQVWNIAFSFYSSIKSIPRELREATNVYRFSRWQRFIQLDLPYGAQALVWNSIMAVAGGWFFLMACEMFQLGKRDFRLPGLGSYLQTAASAGDTRAILWGVVAMVGVVVLMDQLAWRPVLAWVDKFRFENIESGDIPRSPFLTLWRRSRPGTYFRRRVFRPMREQSIRYFVAAPRDEPTVPRRRWWLLLAGGALGIALTLAVGYGLFGTVVTLLALPGHKAGDLWIGAGATFLRVNAALLLGLLWTVPAGVAIGLRPRLARILQPIAQIGASVPATALFPVLLLVLIRMGGGMGLGSIFLILLGTQWYILFNVIAGASALPGDLKEVSQVFRFRSLDQWRLFILPGIFPSLVTGLVTASGGAWNASVVAEYFNLNGKTLSTTGLGATIAQATDTGDFALLLAATIVMSMIVVAMHRLVWHRLYRMVHTKYKLEA